MTFPENHAVYEIMSKNVVERDHKRRHNKALARCMLDKQDYTAHAHTHAHAAGHPHTQARARTHARSPKRMHTVKYVTVIALQWQKIIRERASMLGCTFIWNPGVNFLYK